MIFLCDLQVGFAAMSTEDKKKGNEEGVLCKHFLHIKWKKRKKKKHRKIVCAHHRFFSTLLHEINDSKIELLKDTFFFPCLMIIGRPSIDLAFTLQSVGNR